MQIAGIIVLFCVGVYAGFAASHALRRRIELTESLLSLVRHVQNRIQFFRQELPSIYREYSDESLTEFLSLVGCNPSEASKILAVDQEVRDFVVEFFTRVGRGTVEESHAAAEYCALMLEKHIAVMRETYPQKRKVYCSLGISAGLMAVILLI